MKGFSAHIPRKHIIFCGKLLGVLLYFFDIPHKKLVKRNLQFCYPEWSRHQINELSKGVFKNAGISFLELVQSTFISREDLLGMFRVRGEEHFIDALRGDKGVIVISAHMANWEVGLQFFGCYFEKPMTGVARKMRYGWLDHWLHSLRTRFGNRIIYKKGALPAMTQALRRGGIVGLLVDQSRRRQGVDITFFGREATATPAAALLAIRCKSPVFPMFCIREDDGQLTIHIKPPLQLKRTKDLRSDLQSNTQIMIDAVEEIVREYPDQWMWYQRPWKKAHPELYPEWEARRQRRKKRKKKRAASQSA